MLKRIFILFCALSVHTICGQEESKQNTAAANEPKLDGKPYGVADAIQNTKQLLEGQRQKRFYDYSYIGYNSGSSAFSSIIPTYDYASSDPYHTTTAPQHKQLNEILRRAQLIAELTRTLQFRNPVIPYFIPIPTLAKGCTCPPTNDHTKPAPSTPSPGYLPPDKSPKNESAVPDIGNKFGDTSSQPTVSDEDYDDGVRPISFDPIPPKEPQSVVPPPVEHGSFQAGLDPEPPASRPAVGRPSIPPGFNGPPSAGRPPVPPPQLDEMPLTPPTVCDGAILTCCHQQVVTDSCFAREGCGDLEYDNPCDAKVLLHIVNKLRAHIKARG